MRAMVSAGGYVRVYRSMLDWEWFDDDACVRVMLYLLLAVNWEEKEWHGQRILPGQLVTSMEGIAAKLRLSRSAVRRALSKLKSTGEVTVQTNNHWTTVTLANWGEYQEVHPTNGRQKRQQPTDQRPTADRPAATTEEGKKGRMEEDSSARKTLFVNSGYCDLEAAKAALPELVAKGIDLEAYRDRIRDWSDTKDERRTDRGWLATYKSWVAGDERKGSVLKVKTEGWNPRA